MKVLTKYPTIIDNGKTQETVINDKYEGGWANADAKDASKKKETFWNKLSNIENSGAIQGAIDIANKIKASKNQPGAPAPIAGSPVATSPNAGEPPAGSIESKTGMSTGKQIALAIGIAGVAFGIYYLLKHKKAK